MSTKTNQVTGQSNASGTLKGEETARETFVFTSPQVTVFANPPSDNRRYDNGIRIYRNSPSSATIQIRAHCPTNERGNGKPKFVHATASYVGKEQLQMLVDRLNSIIEEI